MVTGLDMSSTLVSGDGALREEIELSAPVSESISFEADVSVPAPQCIPSEAEVSIQEVLEALWLSPCPLL